MNKKSVKAIISKGGLTGDETGRMFLLSYIAKQNTGTELLTPDERQRLVDNLKSSQAVRQFGGYVNLVEHLRTCMVAAKLQQLSAIKRILLVIAVCRYTTDAIRGRFLTGMAPKIMTDEEYLQKAEAYRKERVRETVTLEDAVFSRLYHYIDQPEKIEPLWKRYGTESDCIQKREPEENTGLETNADLLREEYYGPDGPFGIEELREDFPDLLDRILQDLRESSAGFESIPSLSELTVEKSRSLETTVEQLLSAGFEEHDVLLDNEHFGGIAILRSPQQRQADKNGHYQEPPWEIAGAETEWPENAGRALEMVEAELTEFFRCKAVAYAIIRLVDESRLVPIEEIEEELRSYVSMLEIVIDGLNNAAFDPEKKVTFSVDPSWYMSEKRRVLRRLKGMSADEYNDITGESLFFDQSEENEEDYEDPVEAESEITGESGSEFPLCPHCKQHLFLTEGDDRASLFCRTTDCGYNAELHPEVVFD